MSYPASGTFESQGPCPATHPVHVPQLMYETVWDTRQFNDPADWPEDGKAFYWSMGDSTGYGTHGDYVFGWKDNALQRAMDSPCYVNCPTLKTQSMTAMNSCTAKDVVAEQIDGCKCMLFSEVRCGMLTMVVARARCYPRKPCPVVRWRLRWCGSDPMLGPLASLPEVVSGREQRIASPSSNVAVGN
jgi:hypothetical protein